MFHISVLGAVEVARDGRVVPVPGGRTAELLVRLALDAGRPVRADQLVEDLWADGAVTTSRNTLQSKVARLRRALGDPGVLVSGDGAYRLAVDPSAVDALAVLDDAVQAPRLLDAGDARGAAELSAGALACFGGEVLPGAGESAWARPHRARLEEAHATLLETRLAARLRLGDVGDVVGELEAAVAADPYRERLWELLLTALYRAGRQADALAAYQRVRALLDDELGLEVGPALRLLEQEVLRHDPALRAPAEGRAGNLPSLAAGLVGREREVEELAGLLGRERLVEVVGPGGVGKTALAVAVGRQLSASDAAPAGGVWLVRLETATTAGEVLDAVIAALDVTGGEAALHERVRGAPSVLVLDNCEHVLDAAAALATRLLDAAPPLRVLCTSQVPLDVDGEVVVELAPLALADAAELFARRSAAARRGEQPAGDAVLELCRALDGLPLAIELAAARTRTLSLAEIARRLDDRFTVLRDPASRRPERRRALRATIGWSYDLLFPDDQRGLWAIATFAGGAPLPAVESVLEALDVPAAAAIDVVGRLASRSLVIADDEGPAVRLRLLDSIRAFALDALAEAGLADRARAAHAAWLAGAAAASTEGVRGPRQAEHLAVARAERGNADAALAWCAAHDPPLGLRIATGFGWAWIVLGDSRGADRLLAALAAAGEAAPPRDRATALLLAAWIEASTGRLELATDHIAEAATVADDADLRARCDYYLAYVVSHRGAWARALELTDRSSSALDAPWDQAATWLFAARAAISAGDRERAAAACAQVDRWLGEVDDPWLHVRRDAVLGELARVEHRFDDAVAHLGRAAATSGRLGFLQTEAYQLSSLGRAQCQAGDGERGAATLELAIAKAEATGDVRLAALARVHLGRVLRGLDRPGDARVALEAAGAWHREAGGGEQAALGDCLLAALDRDGGRLAELLDGARRAGDAPVEVFALDALARVAAEGGDAAAARALCRQADDRMAAAAHFITERDRADARAVRQHA